MSSHLLNGVVVLSSHFHCWIISRPLASSRLPSFLLCRSLKTLPSYSSYTHEAYQESSSSSPQRTPYARIAKSLNPFLLCFFSFSHFCWCILLLSCSEIFSCYAFSFLHFCSCILFLSHSKIFSRSAFSFLHFCWCILLLSRSEILSCSAFSCSCFCWCILLRQNYFSLRFSCPDVLLTLLESLHANFFFACCIFFILFYTTLLLLFCRQPDHLFPLLKFCSSTTPKRPDILLDIIIWVTNVGSIPKSIASNNTTWRPRWPIWRRLDLMSREVGKIKW